MLSQGAGSQYIHGHHDSVLRSHRSRTAEDSAGYLIPHLRPGQRLLDVGCGPGTITADLATLVAPGQVTAIDTSQEVITQAGQYLSERGVGNVDLHVADLYAAHPTLGVPRGGYDVVHAHQVLQHVTDPVGALERLRRLCAEDGVVAARDADYAAMTWHPQSPGLDEWLALYRSVARACGGEPDAGRRLLGWAHAAGFDDVTASASTWCYATPQARAWWAGLWAERIVESAIAEQALQLGIATRDDLHRVSRAWDAWACEADGWFVVVHGEVLCRPRASSSERLS